MVWVVWVVWVVWMLWVEVGRGLDKGMEGGVLLCLCDL